MTLQCNVVSHWLSPYPKELILFDADLYVAFVIVKECDWISRDFVNDRPPKVHLSFAKMTTKQILHQLQINS